MKGKDVVVGNEYIAKASGKLQRVRVLQAIDHHQRVLGGSRWVTRWAAVNLATGRTIVIKSAQRLRPVREVHDFTAQERSTIRRQQDELLARLEPDQGPPTARDRDDYEDHCRGDRGESQYDD